MKPAKRFQRRIEDFKCENCGAEVTGRGYTDHCPVCLHGKHVDLNPGDRASGCGGAMRPVAAYHDRRGFVITYECGRCRAIKNVRSAPEDDASLLFKLAEHTSGMAKHQSGKARSESRNGTFK